MLALALFLLLIPGPAATQDQLSGTAILSTDVEISFPTTLTIHLKAESTADITGVRLYYIVNKMNYANVTSEAWPEFSPAPVVATQWTWDMRKGRLPPGTQIKYWWTIEDALGHRDQTSPNLISFDDLRYQWQILVSEEVTLLWYDGNQSFAQALLSASRQALDKLSRDTGARLEKPAKIYIYSSTDDLQGAMIFPREWTGGAAFTEYGIITLGISPHDLDWGKKAIAHELAHLVIHQMTFNYYGGDLPRWLDEGLAMYAEGEISQQLKSRLDRAISENKLISVRSLSSPFSARTEEAYISYAQSHSLVDFLIQEFGKGNMSRLLEVFRTGSTYDRALEQVYGFDQDGLDALWRSYIGATHPRNSTGGMSSLEVTLPNLCLIK